MFQISVAWHALYENEYAHPNIAVSEISFLGVLVQALNFLQGLSLEVWTPRYRLAWPRPLSLESASRSSVRTCQVFELQCYFTLHNIM